MPHPPFTYYDERKRDFICENINNFHISNIINYGDTKNDAFPKETP